MNRTAQVILNIIIGLASFVFFVILMFPLDSVISHYLANLEKETKGEFRLSVSEIDASLLFDSEFKDFRLFQKGKEVFYAPKVKAGISLFALLSSSVNVSFAAEYTQGSISGRVQLSESESVYDVEVDNVNIAELTFIKQMMSGLDYPIHLSGRVQGSLYLLLTRDLKSSEGEINFKVFQAKTRAVAIKQLNMEIPAMALSSKKTPIEIEGTFDKGQVTLSKLNFPGPDFIIQLNGTAKVGRNFTLQRANYDGKFAFSDNVSEKVPFLALLDAQKTTDGYYPMRITGNLKKPKIRIGEMDLSKILKL
jgi:type II secretion system protein N